MSQDIANTALPEDAPPRASVNLNQLLEALGGNRAILHEILDMFLAEVPPLLDELREAVEAGDMRAVQAHAHKLRGVLLNLAADTSAQLAERVEIAGRVGRPQEALEGLPALLLEARRAMKEAELQRSNV